MHLTIPCSPLIKDTLYLDGKVSARTLIPEEELGELYPNCTILLTCQNFKVPTYYKDGDLCLLDRELTYFGIKPRNPEQVAAMNFLNQEDVQAVSITGPPRSGKTLCASDYALWAVERGIYDRLILTRPNIELGRGLGFLPGEIEDKFDKPFLQPINDCASTLGDRCIVDDFKRKGMIETVPIPYIKGRNFKNSLVFVDEAEDLGIEELMIISTRLDIGSKIIFTGDIKQIDNKQIKGKPPFEYMIDKFKGVDSFAHVHFEENQGLGIVDLFYDKLDREKYYSEC